MKAFFIVGAFKLTIQQRQKPGAVTDYVGRGKKGSTYILKLRFYLNKLKADLAQQETIMNMIMESIQELVFLG